MLVSAWLRAYARLCASSARILVSARAPRVCSCLLAGKFANKRTAHHAGLIPYARVRIRARMDCVARRKGQESFPRTTYDSAHVRRCGCVQSLAFGRSTAAPSPRPHCPTPPPRRGGRPRDWRAAGVSRPSCVRRARPRSHHRARRSSHADAAPIQGGARSLRISAASSPVGSSTQPPKKKLARPDFSASCAPSTANS